MSQTAEKFIPLALIGVVLLVVGFIAGLFVGRSSVTRSDESVAEAGGDTGSSGKEADPATRENKGQAEAGPNPGKKVPVGGRIVEWAPLLMGHTVEERLKNIPQEVNEFLSSEPGARGKDLGSYTTFHRQGMPLSIEIEDVFFREPAFLVLKVEFRNPSPSTVGASPAKALFVSQAGEEKVLKTIQAEDRTDLHSLPVLRYAIENRRGGVEETEAGSPGRVVVSAKESIRFAFLYRVDRAEERTLVFFRDESRDWDVIGPVIWVPHPKEWTR